MVSNDLKPSRFLVIGNGRWAVHLMHYLKLLNLSFGQWTRSQDHEFLDAELQKCTHVLLAISDSSLQSFYMIHLTKFSGRVIHFSGALEFDSIIGVHPLMSFGPKIYADEIYSDIPLITTSSLSIEELLPCWKNPIYRIPAKDKAYYHALCVLGGNLTTMLLQKMMTGLSELRLPKDLAKLYVKQVVENVFEDPAKALTGPLARKDFLTIEKNLQSLAGDPFAEVYRSFLPIALKIPSTKNQQEPHP